MSNSAGAQHAAPPPSPVLATRSEARLFLALWPTPDDKAHLVRYLRHWPWPRSAAPVGDEQLHLTLHFIGAVARRRIDEVSAGLRVPITAFALDLTLAEVWPRGIAVLRANEIPVPLQELHSRLAQALHALGLPVETRRFRPHVTLARRAAGVALPDEPPRLRWQVDGYVLVESVAGSGYQIRQRYG